MVTQVVDGVTFHMVSAAGWVASSTTHGDHEVRTQDGDLIAVLPYDYKTNSNAVLHYRSRLVAAAPDLEREAEHAATTLDSAAKALRSDGYPCLSNVLEHQAKRLREVLAKARSQI